MDAITPPPDEGTPYEGAPVVGAVLATIFFPLISLIAALILQGGQTDPRKRAQLRSWAMASGALLVVGLIIVIVVFVVIVHSVSHMGNVGGLGR